MADFLEEMFRQNEWANLRLLAACRALTDEQLDATAVGTYGTIRSTLMHLVSGEATYVRRLGGAVPGAFRTDDPWVGFDHLEAVVRDAASALIERAAVVQEPFEFVDDGVRYRIEPSVILMQAINHGAEHRSHVCTVLTSLGVTPPVLDGWAWGEDTLRERPASS